MWRAEESNLAEDKRLVQCLDGPWRTGINDAEITLKNTTSRKLPPF